MNVKITSEGIRYIALFESLTGAAVRDCIVDDENDRVIFVVKKGDMGIAIGKNGSNINRVKKSIGKHIEIVEYSDDACEFIANIFQPAMIKKVDILSKESKRLAYVSVVSKDKGLAIGRDGRNIQKAKILAQRHHSLDDVIIT
ncbi:MAG: NusA-like transcription termination signal-binding factor [Methanocellales archaeon]|nr:NusA-like transcription termination signal-binding factor [Methanocellales archaeon]MDD3291639.1 NusA-like transcription termination signal-binding factor [Methanocellales archaeon]MDD5235208.1 NusA-like transcription termination signal-binding factor [Methanocellales archaeon]MDD5485422.1 NusA-like transcription termination signal-binding factor [Methanocellales archaeon]